jgi:hypothetical protein
VRAQPRLADKPAAFGDTLGRMVVGAACQLQSSHGQHHSAQHLSSSFDEEWLMDWTFEHAWTSSSIHDVLGTSYLALHFGGEGFDRFLSALAKNPIVLDDKRQGAS